MTILAYIIIAALILLGSATCLWVVVELHRVEPLDPPKPKPNPSFDLTAEDPEARA